MNKANKGSETLRLVFDLGMAQVEWSLFFHNFPREFFLNESLIGNSRQRFIQRFLQPLFVAQIMNRLNTATFADTAA